MTGGGVTVRMFGDLRSLVAKERRASLGALRRAGAYLRGAVRRRIRETRHATSKPGESPRSHGTFRRSILFRVDPSRMVAIVGPGSLLRKPGADGTTPAVLEFGGTTAARANNWFSKDAPAAQTEAGVAEWFRTRKALPLYMAADRAALLAQIRSAGKAPARGTPDWFSRVARKRLHIVGGRREFVHYFPVARTRTDAQTRRAARLTVAHFGMPYRQSVRIAARPYLAPSVESTRADIVKIFANALPPALRAG